MRNLAIEACDQFVSTSDERIPQLLGKMKKAVQLYSDGSDKQDAAIFESALTLVNELIPHLDDLNPGVPEKEIEGIRLYLTSTRIHCLRDLERFDAAIETAHEVLNLARAVKSDKDISAAMALLQRCQKRAGKHQDAIESVRGRFYFCSKRKSILAQDAVEAATDIGDLLGGTASSGTLLPPETVALTIEWYERAAALYTEIGRNERAVELRKQIETLRSNRWEGGAGS